MADFERFDRDLPDRVARGEPGVVPLVLTALQRIMGRSPMGHPGRLTALGELGLALRTRWEHTGNATDLDAALDVWRQAFEEVAADHPMRLATATLYADT